MVLYSLSSSILTRNILTHPEEESERNNQVLEQLERFMSLVEFISKYHKNKNDFLGKWKHIFDIVSVLTNVKDIDLKSHIFVDLHLETDEGDNYIQENQCFGSIVFIDPNFKFSFEKKDKCIGIGITNKKSYIFGDAHETIPINILGSSLVRVVYPTNEFVDERGMFVILDKNQEENSGIGEIISFGDLITRDADSYELVGICSLDKTEQPNSLFLFSTSSRSSRIRFPSNDNNICFVCMVSLPMSDALVELLLQNTPFNYNKQKLMPEYLLL